MDILKHLRPDSVPQSEPLHDKQVENKAGGYVEPISGLTRIERFLILGTQGGTYYAGERELTLETVKHATQQLRLQPEETMRLAGDMSDSGRGLRNDPAILLLALACADKTNAKVREYGFAQFHRIIRTGGHLLLWFRAMRTLGANVSSGASRRTVGAWMTKAGDNLAYQFAKYQQRDGATQRDVLRAVRPKGLGKNAAVRWAATGQMQDGEVSRIMVGVFKARGAENAKECARVIAEYGLTREMVPTQYLKDPNVWTALLGSMPIGAMIRNLGSMTRVGLLGPLSETEKLVVDRLGSPEKLRKSRVHPFAVLLAAKAYAHGRPMKGTGAGWEPNRRIGEALDEAFYACYPNAPATGKRIILALDVSGSMDGQIAGLPISSREVAAAVALVIANTERNHHILGFTNVGGHPLLGFGRSQLTDEVTPLDISPRMRLQDACAYMKKLPMGGTDCALPWRWALARRVQADAIVTITDNETWAGDEHVTVSMSKYRKAMNVEARAVAAATTATEYSIYPETDPLCLNAVGADASLPLAIAAHLGGRSQQVEEQAEEAGADSDSV